MNTPTRPSPNVTIVDIRDQVKNASFTIMRTGNRIPRTAK
jgi:hypothetical protein